MSTNQTHVAFTAPIVITEAPRDARLETHFIAAADCTMDTVIPGVTIADDMALQFEVTYRNVGNVPLQEETFIEAQGFFHVEYDKEEKSKLCINITSARL